MREIRLGLIGTGRWGQNYIKTISNLQGIRLAAIASRSPQSQELVPPDCLVFNDWHQVISKQHIDALIVATPAALHVPMAIEAIVNGIPVLVEKPLCHSVPEAIELKDLAVKRSGFVMVDHIHLFNPAYRSLKKLLSSDFPIIEISSEAGNTGPFRVDAPVLWDWGSHDVALCLDLIGELPIEYEARRLKYRTVGQAIGENLEFRMRFPGGEKAKCVVGNLMKKTRRLAVRTAPSILVFDDVGDIKLSAFEAKAEWDSPIAYGNVIPVPADQPLSILVTEFASAVREGRNTHESLDLAVNVIKVLDCLKNEL
jgi:predicted dehydrogenase